MHCFTPYLETIADLDHRQEMRSLLDTITERFPQLVPRIAWNQPMFTDHGTFIIGFSAAKGHISVAPERKTMVEFADAIEEAGYQASKELFRIRWGQAVNYGLLEAIIEYNVADKADCTSFWRKP